MAMINIDFPMPSEVEYRTEKNFILLTMNGTFLLRGGYKPELTTAEVREILAESV